MIKIDLLKNHPKAISVVAKIWHETLGKKWLPEVRIDQIVNLYEEELKQDFPLTYIALDNLLPVGSCTFQLKEEVWPDLGPWIADLAIDPLYQKQGIGKKLIQSAIQKTKDLEYKQLYVFTFDPSITKYYQHSGWDIIEENQYELHPVTIMVINL